MKQIKFTPENLQRHLNASPYRKTPTLLSGQRIHTCRDKILGDIGDVFFIEGVGKFVLVFVCEYEPDYFEHLILNEWCFEGFSSEAEFRKEIIRIYGEDCRTYYEHMLLKLNVE